MIIFKKFGKTVKIRNDDWKELRERFDAGKARWDAWNKQYAIPVECPLCIRYECGTCPFDVFDKRGERHGCVDFFKKLLKFKHFYFGEDRIEWSKRKNKDARKQLGQILKMMDKIEASQGE